MDSNTPNEIPNAREMSRLLAHKLMKERIVPTQTIVQKALQKRPEYSNPSISSIRNGIDDFWVEFHDAVEQLSSRPGVPQPVFDAANKLYEIAHESAADDFETERKELESEREEHQQTVSDLKDSIASLKESRDLDAQEILRLQEEMQSLKIEYSEAVDNLYNELKTERKAHTATKEVLESERKNLDKVKAERDVDKATILHLEKGENGYLQQIDNLKTEAKKEKELHAAVIKDNNERLQQALENNHLLHRDKEKLQQGSIEQLQAISELSHTMEALKKERDDANLEIDRLNAIKVSYDSRLGLLSQITSHIKYNVQEEPERLQLLTDALKDLVYATLARAAYPDRKLEEITEALPSNLRSEISDSIKLNFSSIP